LEIIEYLIQENDVRNVSPINERRIMNTDKYNLEVLNKIDLFFQLFNDMSDLVYLTKVLIGCLTPQMDICPSMVSGTFF
jgi:hypothetical protein